MAPVAFGVEIADIKPLLQAQFDPAERQGNFSGDKGFAALRRFVIKQDAVAGIQAVGLAVVHGDPVGIKFGHAIGRTRIKRRGFPLRGLAHQAIQFRGRGLIKAGLVAQIQDPDRLQQPQGPERVRIGRIFRLLEGNGHMALRGQIINLVGPGLLYDANQAAGVGHVPIMDDKIPVRDMRVLVEMIDALGIDQGGAALDAVHLIALFEQKLGEIGAVLTGDTRYQGTFRHGWFARGCVGAWILSVKSCILALIFSV